MTTSSQKQVVKVHVDEVRDNGVRVKVVDGGSSGLTGRTGFIRRREIDWDRRIGVIPKMPELGANVEAVLLPGDGETGFLYFSLRQLTDPWIAVITQEKYKLEESVEGDVVNVQHFGAFVQLEPGIDAVIWPKDVPIPKGQTIEDVLWAGDRVRAVVTKADLQRHEIELSVWEELRRLDADPGRRQTQLSLLVAEPEATQNTAPGESPTPVNSDYNAKYHFHPGIPHPTHILVVDDETQELEIVCNGLREKYQIVVVSAHSGKDAVAKIKQGVPYDLVLIDLRLSDGEHGTKAADQLREICPRLPILFMSKAFLSAKDRAAIDTRETPLTSKNLEEIVYWIDRMCSGYSEEIPKSTEASRHNDTFIRQLGMQSFTRRSLPEMLHDMLATLRRETGVANTMVVKLDPESRQVSVPAAEPTLSDEFLSTSLARLYYSPVRNVIEDEEEFRRNDIESDDPRFKNLFPHLDFGSCLGIPITIPDLVTQYALFLFDGDPMGFSPKNRNTGPRIQRARTAARFLANAIERSTLLDYMRQYQEDYAKGQIWFDLTHELSNKLTGLDAPIETLQTLLSDAVVQLPGNERERLLKDAKDAADELALTEAKIKELVETYRKLARGNVGSVDVNSIVEKVSRELQRTAEGAGVKILPELEPHLPPARAISLQLEQVVTNLVLNAIQQMGLQRDQMEDFGKEFGEETYLLQHGSVIVQTRYRGSGPPCPIQIRVIDTGPGIHWQQQRRIFAMGFTRREGGAGLGLFISRNLAEMSGGQLSLAASLMFVGSTFVVDLPAYTVSGESQ